MNLDWSVISCVYNAAPVAKKSILSLLRTLPESAEVILVDNHSPDPKTREWIQRCVSDKVRVVDPGKNLGCHHGWNAGYAVSRGRLVAKFDDDTVIKTPGWGPKMAQALDSIPALAYLSADIDAKQANRYRMEQHGDVELEVAETGVVGFSFVAFRRSDVERWGPMRAGAYTFAGQGAKRVCEEPPKENRFYGGEEVYYSGEAHSEGRFFAHFPAVQCHHLHNSERHPDYVMWKRVYGYYGWTDLDMEAWVESGEHVGNYVKAARMEIISPTPNDALLIEWVRRLGDIGDLSLLDVIESVRVRTQNGALHEACTEAAAKYIERKDATT